jgi:hypothetical protein
MGALMPHNPMGFHGLVAGIALLLPMNYEEISSDSHVRPILKKRNKGYFIILINAK